MTIPRARRRAVAAAFTLTLLVAACGGGDDSADDDPPETTRTTEAAAEATTTEAEEEETTTTTEDEGPSDDEVQEARSQAKAINLRLEDFADGWEEEPADDDDSGAQECFRNVDVDEVEVVSVDSPTFSITVDPSRGQVVQVSTIVVDEEASAEAMIDEIGTNQYAGCMQDVLIDSAEEGGVDLSSSGFEVVEGEGGLGDDAIGIVGSVSIGSRDGSQVEGTLAIYFIRTRNVVTGVQVLDLGDVAFEETLTDLLAIVAERQAAAVG